MGQAFKTILEKRYDSMETFITCAKCKQWKRYQKSFNLVLENVFSNISYANNFKNFADSFMLFQDIPYFCSASNNIMLCSHRFIFLLLLHLKDNYLISMPYHKTLNTLKVSDCFIVHLIAY